MKKIFTCIMLSLFVSLTLHAQSVGEKDIKGFSERVVLENDTVRVIEATLAPGSSEPVHSHQYSAVIYILEAGDFIDRNGQGQTIMDTRKLPKPLTLPFTVWKTPSGPHSVENLSKTVAMKLLRVEVKK